MLLAALLAAAAAEQSVAARGDHRERYLQSFDRVWSTIRDKHWDADMGGLDWNAVRDELRPRIERSETPEEAVKILRDLVNRVGQSHFAILPANRAAVDDRPLGSGVTGLEIRLVDGAARVARIRPNSPASRTAVRIGWELVEARGERVADILERVREDRGDTSQCACRQAQAAHARLTGKPGERLTARFRTGDNQLQDVEFELAEADGQWARLGHFPGARVRVEHRWLRDKVAYLSLSAFMSPAKVMPEIAAALRTYEDSVGLVLDLRGNPGGIGMMAAGLAGFFVSEKLSLGTMRTRAEELQLTANPRNPRYTRPLVILVDECTFSTAEIFAAGLQHARRARILGAPTGGSALPSTFEVLPSGDRFQFAFADYRLPDGSAIEGVGVSPDRAVPLTKKALLQGKDLALEAAIDALLHDAR